VVAEEPLPRSLRLAAALVVAEGVALGALTLSYAGLIIAGEPHNRALALFGALIGLLFGAVLVAAGRGLHRRRRAAYSPTLLIQLLAVPVGIGLIQGGQPWTALGVLVPSVVVLGLLVATSGGRSVLEDGDEAPTPR
jgi:hypothetical protein